MGDMNTECKPGSCVAALVPGAPVPSDAEMRAECASDLRLSPEELPEGALQKWAELWGLAAAAPALHRVDVAHVATGPTRAGFDHDKDEGPCVAWRLDHIFFTPRTLQLHSNWTALDVPCTYLPPPQPCTHLIPLFIRPIQLPLKLAYPISGALPTICPSQPHSGSALHLASARLRPRRSWSSSRH